MTSSVGPNVEEGIKYWTQQPATYDGVLGGFGTGSLPRIESLGSRLFLLNLYPDLSTVPSAFRPYKTTDQVKRIRALDVGAGVGRVTADVLLPLVSDVVLLEPVEPFVQEALKRASASAEGNFGDQTIWPGLTDQTKSVTILQGTLQEFDPLKPHHVKFLDRIGYQSNRLEDDIGLGFDIIWCQWCLGHLNDNDLIGFLRRSRAGLKKHNSKSLIVVKENICPDSPDGSGSTVFDEQDSSLTRSNRAWKDIFKAVDLTLIQEKVQEGLPDGLYAVKMYALR